jgi:hypothetical protein
MTMSNTSFEREYLGQWPDLSWQKPGACCFYTAKNGQKLPAEILHLGEAKQDLGRAWCRILTVTGRETLRWMRCSELSHA